MGTVLEDARTFDELAIHHVLSSANGRRFVMIVLGLAHWGEDVFAVEPTALAFNVGKQSVGIELRRKLEQLQPDLMAQAVKEDHDWQELVAREIENGRARD